jgi:hypothetical protein
MIRKLKDGRYRLYSRKKNPKTGKRRNLGTFTSRAAAQSTKRRSNSSNERARESRLWRGRHARARFHGRRMTARCRLTTAGLTRR